MLSPKDFRFHILRPTLKHIELWSAASETLLLGTALTESGLRWLRQKGNGPGLGLFQIEPATNDDVWKTYLSKSSKMELKAKIIWLTSRSPLHEQLVSNLAYATAMARVIYWRRPEAMPEADDIDGLAKYWKDHYNTHLGAGKVEHFVQKLRPHM